MVGYNTPEPLTPKLINLQRLVLLIILGRYRISVQEQNIDKGKYNLLKLGCMNMNVCLV